MSPEITVLALSAATIACVHTLLGPDHYLPFVAMARARGWSLRRTLRVTLWCGLGHLVGSVLLGVVGIAMGTALSRLQWVESVRGEWAAWTLTAVGLVWMAWGLRRAWRRRPHRHWHRHDGVLHCHVHTHEGEHAHVHAPHAEHGPAGSGVNQGRSVAPWVVFVVFVLGPCEPLIPLLMYPAATHSPAGVLLVTVVFGVVTVATMAAAVTLAMLGLRGVRLGRLERYDHALAGFALFACGFGMAFLGL